MKTLVAAAEPPERPGSQADTGPWVDESYTFSSEWLDATVTALRSPLERVVTATTAVLVWKPGMS